MDSSDSSKPAPPPKPNRRKGAGATGEAPKDPFDIWLQRGLHQLYDNIAAEPVPPELLRLIEEDRTRRGD